MRPLHKHHIIRILLNILFTACILFAAAENNNGKLPLFPVLLYNLIIFVPAWINNFRLLPQLRRDKKLGHYILYAAITFITTALLLGKYLQGLQQKFHTTELHAFTPIAVTASAPEILRQYSYYFDAFPAIMIIMILMVLGYAVQELVLKINKEKQIKKQHTAAELRLLKSQISPHFLFNVLNSLYALALKKAEETPDVILKLSDILRYSLYDTQEKEVSVADELHIINTYIAIERLRIPENARISFVHDKVEETVRIAPMLLLPLVENAIKHGIDSTIGSSYIEAALQYRNKMLIFTCKNSFKEATDKEVGGIGLQNIHQRLHLLYPLRHRFEVEKKESEFKVILSINL